MTTRKKTPIAILGGGITGLVTAACFERAGLDYLLIDAQEEFGGLLRGQQEHGLWLDYGLKSIPVGEELSTNPLIKLKKQLELQIQIESFTEPTKTMAGKNELADFVGFGETKARTLVQELSYYISSPRILVSGGWQNLISELLAIIPEDKRISKTHVTKIEISDDNVTAITLNGNHSLQVDRVIYTFSPAMLKDLIPVGTLSPKLLQRIAKTEPLTAINLDIATTHKVSESKNIFIFNDTVDADFYVVGQFISNVDPLKQNREVQISSWVTLVDSEMLQDDENGSKAIKTMKKLIKKVFPDLIEKKLWERLLVVPGAIGHFDQLQLEKNSTLPGLNNLWMAGAQTKGDVRNIPTAIDSALTVAEQVINQLVPADMRQNRQEPDLSPESPTI